MYTVKQLADLAGITPRTLHHYDEIGLLAPSEVGANGYRYYDGEAVFRLQQILFFRELDFSLKQIAVILNSPGFDRVATLRAHRRALEKRIERLRTLLQTIDRTIMHLTGELDMTDSGLFDGLTPEQEQRYREQATEQYGPEEVDASYQRWHRYGDDQKAQIMAEGNAIYSDLAALTGQDPASPPVQAIIARWHQHMRYFYEPSVARLRGLGGLYVDNPAFAEKFRQLHPDLPEFMRAAIAHYCDGLAGNE